MSNTHEGPAIIAGAHQLSSIDDFRAKNLRFKWTDKEGVPFETDVTVSAVKKEKDEQDKVEVVLRLEGLAMYIRIQGIRDKGWALTTALCADGRKKILKLEIKGHFGIIR